MAVTSAANERLAILEWSTCLLVRFHLYAVLEPETAWQIKHNVICSFFEDYKKNEGKVVKVEEIVGAAKAKETILASMVRLSTHPLVHCSLAL